MANVTGTTADKFIDEIWSAELNRAVEFKLVIAGLFSDWSGRMTGSGDVFHLPARHNLTANTKSAGSDATPEAITETEQTFTVSTHQIVAQEIEDFAEVMSKYDIRAEYTTAASYALDLTSKINTGPPITAVRTPTGSSCGSNAVRATVSASTSRIAPNTADAGITMR